MGLTQQAFFLLKEGWTVMYLLLVEPSIKEQATYKQTRRFNGIRFLRNTSRTLGFPEVVAGSGATVANLMSTVPEVVPTEEELARGPSSFSPNSPLVLWATVSMLQRPILCAQWDQLHWCFRMERPYTVELVQEAILQRQGMSVGILVEECVDSLTTKLSKAMRFPVESKLEWLSGSMVESQQRQHHPLFSSPSTLIQKHFFNPATALDANANPFLGKGLVSYTRREGLDVNIASRWYKSCLPSAWSVFYEESDDERRRGNVAADFDGVEFAFYTLRPSMLCRRAIPGYMLSRSRFTVARFHEVASLVKQEILKQGSKGNDEVNERLAFIAIQLACREHFPSTTCVSSFVECLREYLCLKQDKLRDNILLREFYTERRPRNKERKFNLRFGKEELQAPSEDQKEEIKRVLDETKMPWVVPASGVDAVEKMMRRNGPFPLMGLNLTAIIPIFWSSIGLTGLMYSCWHEYNGRRGERGGNQRLP